MTTEQAEAFAQLRRLAATSRLRVRPDAEGWPVIPGRLGQIEWYCNGQDCHGCPLPGEPALAVYTDRPRLFPKLWALPGVRRWQTGDCEMRAVFPPEALDSVAEVIRARRRRTLSPERARRLGAQTAYRVTSRRQDDVRSATPGRHPESGCVPEGSRLEPAPAPWSARPVTGAPTRRPGGRPEAGAVAPAARPGAGGGDGWSPQADTGPAR